MREPCDTSMEGGGRISGLVREGEHRERDGDKRGMVTREGEGEGQGRGLRVVHG